MTAIEQVMVQRVGGWVLITPADWKIMAADEQANLLAQDAVQFFADGAMVDPAVAVSALAGDIAAKSPAVITSERRVQLHPVRLVAAIYKHVVIEGPAWQVQRGRDADQMVPMSEFRDRSGRFYDLETSAGVDNLGRDLIADVYGIADSIDHLGGEALEHFRHRFFDQRLGTRAWSVEAADVRNYVEGNPFIELVY